MSQMKAALYARVSTDDGRQDAENQLVELRRYCERSGWAVVAEYVDHVSGKSGNRPQFQAMFAGAGRREFDVVLFWSLDRLTREGTLATLRYLEQLTGAGVAWKSYTEQYLDSMGPFSEAVLAILACIAAQERLRISERTKAGLSTARRNGKTLGRPPKVFRRDEAVRLRGEGLSWGDIAKRLGVPVSTVRDAVNSTDIEHRAG